MITEYYVSFSFLKKSLCYHSKDSGIGTDFSKNHRTISNLPFPSNVLEGAAARTSYHTESSCCHINNVTVWVYNLITFLS
jgi:hypothetical protein